MGIATGINRVERIYRAGEIPVRGFGELQQTQQQGSSYVTIVEVPAYQLICGCITRSSDPLGQPCPACLIAQNGELIGVSPERIFAATPCSTHYRVCAAPYCKFLGGCTAHMALRSDGHWYCREHYMALDFEQRVAEIDARHGWLAARAFVVFMSLFAPDYADGL